MTGPALQDQIPHNHCFGCGPGNSAGLRLKSHWNGSGPSRARFLPQPHHCAGPTHFVNGGILATLIDCHSVCTAAAAAYLASGRPIGSTPHLHYATTSLTIAYARPTPLGAELELFAEPVRGDGETYLVSCVLRADGKDCVRGTVTAVRVPESWMHARPPLPDGARRL